MKITTPLFLLLYFLNYNGIAQCDVSQLNTYEVRAKDTDNTIGWEFNKHFAYYNPSCTQHKNILLFHFVGSYDNPKNTKLFPAYAANNGFHVICLKYENNTAARTACENSTDPDCYAKWRREIIEGIDYSTEVTINPEDAVENRLIKLLQYLHTNHPSEGWDTYFSGSTINWGEMYVSGHSQGGGHAGIIANDHIVKRVIMFASPNDYSVALSQGANWTNATHATADSLYYGFLNLNDGVVSFSEQFEMFGNLGMANFGDSVWVDIVNTPYNNSHQLYTQIDSTGTANHSLVIRDSETPMVNGTPLFIPVWEYLLGLNASSLTVTENQILDFDIAPSPSTGALTINSNVPNWSINIYNSIGALVYQQQQITTTTINLNLSNLSTGIYQVRIENATGKVGVQKWVKH